MVTFGLSRCDQDGVGGLGERNPVGLTECCGIRPLGIAGHHYEGNFPLINYFPSRVRNKLCPYARAYTSKELQNLVNGLQADILVHTQIYAGYDNIAQRHPRVGNLLRRASYALEGTPLRAFGLSHFMVLRKSPPSADGIRKPQGGES